MKFLFAVALGAYVVRPVLDVLKPVIKHTAPAATGFAKDLVEHLVYKAADTTKRHVSKEN